MNVFLDFRAIAKRVCLSQRHTTYLPSSNVTRRIHISAPVLSKYQKPKNDNIPFKKVHLVDPESGNLVETTMAKILAEMDSKMYYAELQVPEPVPIVKLINKSEAHNKKLRVKEQQRVLARKNVRKEFQFTWGMAEGDVGHKLERARLELVKGAKVDLCFAPKRKQKPPSPQEAQDHMELFIERLKDVAIEWKPRELNPRGIAAIFLQSTSLASSENSNGEDSDTP